MARRNTEPLHKTIPVSLQRPTGAGVSESPSAQFPSSEPAWPCFRVALVGRQNVGKSTLFNKLLGRRRAIVHDLPGVTRDYNETVCSYRDRSFILMDMAGVPSESDTAPPVLAQLETILQKADHILFVMDAREGLTPADEDLYDRLRGVRGPVYLVVNKTEGAGMKQIGEFYKLGQEIVYPISAEHNQGLSDLLDALYPFLQPSQESRVVPIPKIVIMGRPNAGKSTLMNTLLKEERLMTSPIPGTTRDAIDVRLSHQGKDYLFIDTAGIRKRGKVGPGVEQYSVLRAKEALARADIALLLLDGSESITEQDTKLVGEIIKAGRGLVPLINKADLLTPEDRARLCNQFDLRFPFLKGLEAVFISGKTGTGTTKIFKTLDKVYEHFRVRIATGDLNRFLEKTVRAHSPPGLGRQKIYYITQASTAPPTFILFTHTTDISVPYLRFLENSLRTQFGFMGVPIRIHLRKRRPSGQLRLNPRL